MTRPILILSSISDRLSTSRVTEELTKLSENYLLVNFEEVVLSYNWSFSFVDDQVKLHIVDEKGRIWSDFKSVWLRRWGYPTLPSSFDKIDRDFCFTEINSLILSLPHILTAKWINPINAERTAALKIRQLILAKSLNFETPNTIVTNDPNSISRLVDNEETVIFKPLSGYSIPTQIYDARTHSYISEKYPNADLYYGETVESRILFTQELTEEHTPYLQDMKWSPIIFQPRIEKAFDLRVTFVGTSCFACLINSQKHEEGKLDFRRISRGCQEQD
ncbi:MvdC/MvdD family ATP grasp protein [Deinococcus aetherius]|uniref:MvdC/MvdD family ATP grasp protein n=1 Tax=Deinococcus aetherius TaxID=200252 RepID=UPI002232A547|nr:hypothetical protein [Deinococcus aetherius]